MRTSPNSRYVVYVATTPACCHAGLYSVPVTGGKPVQLNVTPATDGGYDFVISPDSSRVVFLAGSVTSSKGGLFSVPIAGGVPTQINAPLGSEERLTPIYQISPDSSRVIYRTRASLDAPDGDIYSVPIAGGSAVRLNTPLTSDQQIEGLNFSPDSQYVWYIFLPATSSTVWSLYRVPVAGGTPVKIDDVGGYLISPDSQYVVYLHTEPSAEPTLYATPLAGGAPITLDTPAGTYSRQITSDSRRVILETDTSTGQPHKFYSTLLTGGGTAIKLAPLVDFTNMEQVDLSPDGKWFVYGGSDGTTYRVNTVPVDGGSTNTYSAEPTPLSAFAISPDSRHVIYLAGGEQLYSDQLYSAPLAGGTPISVGEPVLFPGRMDAPQQMRFTSDGRTLIYRAEKPVSDNYYDLLMTPIDETAPSTKLNGSVATVLALPSSALPFLVTANGKHVVFLGASAPDDWYQRQLYVTALGATSNTVFLPTVIR